jgi:putative transposase
VPERPTSWQTFLQAHWAEIASADFFTTEVWTWRGLVTFYTVFAIELATRRVQILGSTPHPDEAFMRQIVRNLTPAESARCRVLICDRDAKWSQSVGARLQDAGLRVIQTPYRAPNANAYAERFIGSVRRECLDHVVVLNAAGLRRILKAYVVYYSRSRTDLSLNKDAPISRDVASPADGDIITIPQVGGLHHRYERRAA